MENLFIQLPGEFQKMYPYDWFCGPGSHNSDSEWIRMETCKPQFLQSISSRENPQETVETLLQQKQKLLYQMESQENNQ